MHPLVDNLELLSTHDLETKITDLSKKYFLTKNVDLQYQISSVIDSYKIELEKRRKDEWDRLQEKRDKGLDKLINID